MTPDTPADGALDDAIAELQAMELDDGDYWTEDEVRRTQSPNDLRAIAIILNAVLSGDLVPKALQEEAVVAGWNACRLSVYAVCEDIQDREAEEITDQGDHAQGYKRGLKRAAKSIARGFGAMEARDDDGVRTTIETLKGADNG